MLLRYYCGVIVVGLALIASHPASAQTVALANLPSAGPYTGSDQLGTTTNGGVGYAAVSLINTGSTVSLISVLAQFTNSSATISRTVFGGVYSNNNGAPGGLLVAFNQQTINPSQSDIVKTFIPGAPFTFSGGTSYWIVFYGDQPGNYDGTQLIWRRNVSNNAPTPAAGFATNGYVLSTNGGANYAVSTSNDLVQVNVMTAPEPASIALLAVSGMAAVGIRRRRRG